MVDQFLACLCRGNRWRPGGASFGPYGSSQWFTCTACGRLALSVYYCTGVFLITRQTGPEQFSESEIAYVNGALMTALRFLEHRKEEARVGVEHRYWDAACDRIGVPRGTEVGEVPEERRKAFRALLSYMDDEEWRNPRAVAPFVPPQLPATLVAFTGHGGGWERVDPRESAALLVPLDPIRVAHNAFWKEIFESLRPLANFTPIEIPNEYEGSPHQPWYTFEVNGTRFTVGPRHRVSSVSAAFPKYEDVSEIARVAKRDDVTYEAGSTGARKQVTIHAWDKYRLVEYMSVFMRIALAVPAQE